ncbi:OmpA family protein [Burkholderia sp. BCC1988]|uniref:OmpA family protein n=1 Tax=Burkholderia sp. BCC1988 TaxID=2817443 RepID=UPI002AB30D5E|nr:OmpA family protein [Burkholderia sp. BCC1988]
MNAIDLVQTVSSTFAPPVCEQLSARIGLAPNVIRGIVEHGTAAVLASVMAQCATRQHASASFSAILSPAVNARIGEHLGVRLADTAGLKDLETTGDQLSARVVLRRISVLSDPIAAMTGVPAQATHVLVALSASVGFGMLKHHLLIEQASEADFVSLMRHQFPSIAPFVSDGVAQALGFKSAADFAEAIRQPAAVSSEPETTTPVYGPVSASVSTTVNTAVNATKLPTAVLMPLPTSSTGAARASGTPSFAPKVGPQVSAANPTVPEAEPPNAATAPTAPNAAAASDAPAMAKVVYRPAPRRRHSRRGLLWLLALLAAGGATTYAYEQNHPGFLKSTFTSQEGDGAVRLGSTAPVPGSAPAASAADSNAHASGVAAQTIAPTVPVSSSAGGATAAVPGSDASAGTPTAAQADAVHSMFAMRVDGAGFPHIAATVGNDEQRQKLLDLLKGKFGAGRFDADIAIANGTHSDWLEHLDVLSALMAVRGAEVSLRPMLIELAGPAADGQDAWIDRLQQAFGPSWRVVAFDAAARVGQASQTFRHSVVKAIDDGHPCAPADVERVLNTQIIDFAHSSGHVPATAKDNLGEAAMLLKICASVEHPVKVEIAVFTDSVGDEQALTLLSRKRAESIRAQLIADGVPAPLLTANGYGATHPVESDVTSIGRFANRRVQFNVQR